MGRGIMNRRELFLSSAKAALLTALGGLGLTGGAKAQPAKAATDPGGWVSKVYNLIGTAINASYVCNMSFLNENINLLLMKRRGRINYFDLP